MDLDRIQELLKLMESHKLEEIEIEDKDFRVRLKKEALGVAATVPHAPVVAATAEAAPAELLPPGWPSQRTHELFHTLTRTVDQLDLADGRYDYLFHLIRGMEVLETFRLEGDDSLHWPSERNEEL